MSEGCWNKILSPRWSLSCTGCHVSKPKLRQLLCPCKCSAWPETQPIQPIPKHQASSGLYTYFPVPYSFSVFLFLLPHSFSRKSLLPSAPFCSSLSPWGQRLPAWWSIKESLFVSPKLSSWIIFNSRKKQREKKLGRQTGQIRQRLLGQVKNVGLY